MHWLELRARAGPALHIHIAPECADDPGRVQLSAGTRPVSVEEMQGGYEEEARMPREPWRLPGAEETDALLARDPPDDYGRSIVLVRLSGPVSEDRAERLRCDDEEVMQREIFDPLAPLCDFYEPFKCLGWTSNDPDRKTVTIDTNINQFIGLHVDSWEDLSLDIREQSTNRICINVGSEARWFLFLPFSVVEIARIMGREIGAENVPPRDLTLLGRMFMGMFPDVPVVRCRLQPNEAYIAPTENLVHDGSSEGQTGLDQAFTVLGHIRLRSAEQVG
jgi:hypothetical protein